MNNRKLLSIAVATLSLPLVAEAQQSELLEEVIVTAQKREQSASDIGVSISAFSNEQIEALGIRQVTDVLAFTPGATTTERGNGIPIYTIRGIGFDDYTVNSSSTVGVNYDEVAIPYPAMTRGPQYDIERVEVLKGPQGTLYGQNTTGGTINFIHNKADLSGNSVSVKVGFNSDSRSLLEGFFNLAHSDTLATRLSYYTTQGGDWQKNVAVGGEGQENGAEDKLGLRLGMTWLPSENFSVSLKADYHRDKSDVIFPQHGGFRIISAGRDPNVIDYVTSSIIGAGIPNLDDPTQAAWDPQGNTFSGQHPSGDWGNDNKGLLLTARLDWDLEGMTLTSLTSHNDYDLVQAHSRDAVAVNNADRYNETDIKAWSQELRLTSTTDGPLQWIAGLYYAEDELDEISTGSSSVSTPQLFAPPSAIGDANGDGVVDHLDVIAAGLGFDLTSTQYTQENESFAVFFHTDYEVSDRFSVNLGLRYTEDERTIIDSCTYDVDGTLANFFVTVGLWPLAQQGDCVTQPFIGAPGGPAPFNKTIKTDNVSGKLGVDYRASDDTLIYASISSGYKAGGFGAPAAAVWASLDSYKEEEVLSYELGVKSTLADGRVQLNAAVYHYDYDDKQVQGNILDPTFGTLSKVVNAPKSEVSGVELELNWYVTDSTLVKFATSYLHTEYKEFEMVVFGQDGPFDPATGLLIPEDLSGQRLQNTPEWQHNLMAHHIIDVSGSLDMFIGGDIAYSDGFHAVAGELDEFFVDDWTVTNLRAGLTSKDGRWQLTARINNLFDETYFTSSTTTNDSVPRVVGRERNYGLDFRYNWGGE